MKIGELSRATGVSPRLLRYYEQQSLLVSDRRNRGHRHYSADTVERVRRIRSLLDAGIPTRLIRELLPCYDSSGERLESCVLGHLQDQLRDIDERITTLERARTALNSLLTGVARPD